MSASSEFQGSDSLKKEVWNEPQTLIVKPAEKNALNFHAQLLDTIERAVIATDLDGIVIYWNRFAERLYGWTAAEASGINILELVSTQPSLPVAEEIMSLLRRGESWTGEFTARRKDGATFPIQSVNSPIYDDQGALIGIVGISHDITERKLTEKALQESENKYRTLVEQASDGIHTYDFEGNFLEVNSKLCEMLGYHCEELLRLNVRDLLPDADIAADPIRYDELRAGKTLLRERRLVRKDGTTFPSEISGKMIRDGVLQAIIRDVSERKKAEMELRDRENEMRLIADAMPLLVSYVDREHRYRFVNRSYTEWFGKPREEVVGKHLSEVLGEAAYRSLLPEVEAVLSGEEVIFERLVPYKSGERFIRVNYIPEFDDSTGAVKGFHAFVQDISESRRAEEALRKSEEWLRSIFEASRDGILVEDNGKIIYVNKSYVRLFGYETSEELIGQPVAVVISPEDSERVLGYGKRRLQPAAGEPLLLLPDEPPPSNYEFKGRQKNGAVIDVEASVSTSSVGAHTYITTMVRDVSERKQDEEALRRSHEELETRVLERTEDLQKANQALQTEILERRQAEEARVEVLHQLVNAQEDVRRRIARDLHDQLGQQLTVLRLNLDILKKMCRADESISEQISEIQKVARGLDSDVDFLAWELRPSTLDDLGIADALDNYVRQWSKHFGIEAEFNADRFDKQTLSPEAETNLYRIAQEALNNICKHAKASRVSVQLEPRGNSLVLIIEDNGIGFELHEIAFEENNIKGMGLIGMRERAALVGGTLEIESAAGKGATIYIRIPILNFQKESRV